jgi:hypothetical protein
MINWFENSLILRFSSLLSAICVQALSGSLLTEKLLSPAVE